MRVVRQGPLAGTPLVLQSAAVPEPGPGELLVRVRACGVCRTDLHLVEGDLPARRLPVTPGHQVVGAVERCGPGAERFVPGERVGIAWLRSTCGACSYCLSGRENLCPRSRYTGWDEDGGFAEYAVVGETFAYAIPERYDDVAAAPLLCAGIIGYRALDRSGVGRGGRLGLFGFGSSAHIALQIAVHRGLEVHVFTRGARHRSLAIDLGAARAGGAEEAAAGSLDGAVLFAPVGTLVPAALSALRPGGTLAIAGIHLTTVPALSYAEHLFHERALTSVTANTRADGAALLTEAAEAGVRPVTKAFPLEEANGALLDLAASRLEGTAVLVPR